MAETISIHAKDGSGAFNAYVATPENGDGPAIIAIQEIFGVNEGMRQICDDLAAQGYIAICPDLFWRQELGVSITDKTQQELDKAFSLYQGFDAEKGIEDITATIETARSFKGCSGKVGAVGYCLGGFLAYMTAARTDIDASVSFYGVGIDRKLDESTTISKPLILHIAEEDGFVDKDAQARIHKELDGHTQITIHDYANVDHAFARPDGMHWNNAAATLANKRTADFFTAHLKD
jgi:carboxymethylenebutenolidase